MKRYLPLLSAVITLVAYAGLAYAGTGGTEFGDVYDMVSGWTTGTLGRIISVGMFLVGMGIGIARQSLMPIVLGVGGALALNYTPSVVEGIVTAMM